MKRILIVSYFFAPENIIGAIRPTKLAKELVRQGYDVTVVCGNSNNPEDAMLKKDCELINKIIRIKHSSHYTKIRNMIFSTATSLGLKSKSTVKNTSSKTIIKKKSYFKKYLSNLAMHLLDLYRDFDFCKRASKSIKFDEYEIVFSSYSPIGSHFFGRWIKRKNKNIKWIADFRDPMRLEIYPFGMRSYIRHLQNSFCEKSDYITAVSKGSLNQIINRKYLDKSAVITNGYDICDFETINKGDDISVEKFTFVYTGGTYDGKRDLSPLFRVISELINEGEINKDKIQFYYAGNEGRYVKQQAEKYKCDNIVIDLGFISRIESLKLQNQAHVLVVTTWNSQNNQGVLSGKFLEYMLFKKPIIAIVSGDVENSEISQIIEECQIGTYYEQSQHEKHFTNIKEYILKQYVTFINKESVEFNPILKNVDMYSYANLTQKLSAIIESLDGNNGV
jgi:glycosyltransferase involved in cell wall biosynthesis